MARRRLLYDGLQRSVARLAQRLAVLRFQAPVAHVYNPLDYAREMHLEYLRRYAQTDCTALLLGMNPGPWGMAQTGVPFGEVTIVRDWLRLDRPIGRPPHEHPKRPVLGLQCARSEVSGARLWGWARHTFGTPQNFFRRFFLANYCPLAFLEDTGRNRTPDKLPAAEREPLFAACDDALRTLVSAIRPQFVIGVGRFAEDRAQHALDGVFDGKIGRILHPSPASPAANRGWSAAVRMQLQALGISLDA